MNKLNVERIEKIKSRLEKSPDYNKGMFNSIEGMEFLWEAKPDITWLLEQVGQLKDCFDTSEKGWNESLHRIADLQEENNIMIEALEQISNHKYELNPWTVGPSTEAQIAQKVLDKIKKPK